MTKKEKTLKAWKELEGKYRNVTRWNYIGFFKHRTCPLCEIHRWSSILPNCLGCPLADREGLIGCTDFKTYWEALVYKHNYINKKISFEKLRKVFIRRADFFKKYYPVIKKIPSKRFTKSGWKFFNELDRRD